MGDDFKRPDICVDIIVFFGDCILLIDRNEEPLGLALPGGHVDYGECCEAAAIRELKEESGLDVTEEDLELLCVMSDPERDPRRHKISICYSTTAAHGIPKAASDAKEVHLVPIHTLPDLQLAFDHDDIINRGLSHDNSSDF